MSEHQPAATSRRQTTGNGRADVCRDPAKNSARTGGEPAGRTTEGISVTATVPMHKFVAAPLRWGDITIEVVEVSPSRAEAWLAKNTHNRSLRKRTITTYATDMAAGDWSFTGEPVTFAADGRLLDGQHRLHAIVEAAVTVPLVVICGLANEAQEDTDRGVPRKFYDVLQLRGEVNATHLASIVRRVHMWELGARQNIDTGSGLAAATVAQYLRTLDRHPEIREFVAEAKRIAKGCELPASIIGTLWWVFSRIDSEDADFFFERLADGQNLAKGNPIYELSRSLDNIKSNSKGERSQTYLMALTIKAWNLYRTGEEIQQIRWRKGGSRPEAFPEPV